MSWREFEMLVAELFRRQGYRVMQADRGADGGIDVECHRGAERFLVQCKHWSARLVDVKVVRELKGVVAGENATGGAVVTTGQFTRDALEFAQRANVELFDGERLQVLANELTRRDKSRAPDRSRVPNNEAGAGFVENKPVCPRCGAGMVLRTAKRGTKAGEQFWGCQQYPKCKGTVSAGASRA